MSYVFKKLIEGAFASICDGLGFKLITTTAEPIIPPPILEIGQIDLSVLGLSAGTYRITATALSTGIDESPKSKAVTYKVK